jgi:cytochrome b6-f complex iron-sulfur subunit
LSFVSGLLRHVASTIRKRIELDLAMADTPGKKLTTAEILAKARAEKLAKAAPEGGAAPASESAPASEAAPASASETAPASEAAAVPEATKPAAPSAGGEKPTGTAAILAAARAAAAAKAGGAAPAASSATPAGDKPAAAAAAGGDKPTGTAAILAAARAAAAAKAGGDPAPEQAPAASEKPAAAVKPAAKKAAAETVDGPKLSVQEMLAAVRPATGKEAGAGKSAEPVVAAVPVMPAKPTPVKARQPTVEERRGVFATIALILTTPFYLAWVFFSGATAVFTLASARFMMPNLLVEPPSQFKVGPPSDYDLNTVSTKWVAQYGVWIVHTDQYQGKNLIYALLSVCTHLGCTPSWLDGEQKYKCPCHGSGFYINGINFEGPAPRPLERVGLRLAEDGMLEVDKSLKFQEEMGQWSDPASFVEA